MGCKNPISAYVDHDMPSLPNIYCFPGSPTLPRNNASFCKLVLVAFAEKLEKIPIYFVRDCLRNHKMVILGILGGGNFICVTFFVKMGVFSPF